MARTRVLGIDAQLLGVFESVYGTPPDGTGGGVYRKLRFGASSFGTDGPMGYDPVLGLGRDRQDPYDEPTETAGDIRVPIDTRGTGFWLKAVFGAPVTTGVKAAGTILFGGNPTAGDTITLNGTVWEFVASGASGPETNIAGNLAATLAQLVSDLNGSADTEVAKCTYAVADGTTLTVERDTAGSAGNTFTLAASAATVSAATLTGGGRSHVFTSGGELPSMTLETGHMGLATPLFEREFGVKAGQIAIELARAGAANAALTLLAQGEVDPAPAAAVDAAPLVYDFQRFSRGRSFVTFEGSELAGVPGGQFTYSNALEPLTDLKEDGTLSGIDEGEGSATGTVSIRFGPDSAARAKIGTRTPVALGFGWAHPDVIGSRLTIDCPRTFLPRKKKEISGPAGVVVAYEWQAAKDPSLGYMTRVTLKNDVESY